MAARTGMANLILRLRAMTEASASEYSVNSVAYWTDDQLQDILDQHVDIHYSDQIQPISEIRNSTTEWHDYPLGAVNIEEVSSAWPYWLLVDSTGATISTGFTLDPLAGLVHFTTTTNAAVYWATFRAYRLEEAAADVWRKKAGHAWTAYDFTTESQSFSRSQMYDHAQAMATTFANQGGMKFIPMYRSDLA